MPQSPDINRMLVSIKGAEEAIRPVVGASTQEVKSQERDKFSQLWRQLKAKERRDNAPVEVAPGILGRQSELWAKAQADEDLMVEMKGLADLVLGSSKTRDQELTQLQGDYGDDFEPMLINGLRARADEALVSRKEFGRGKPGQNNEQNANSADEDENLYIPSTETEKTVFFLATVREGMSRQQWEVVVGEIRSRLSLSKSLVGFEDVLESQGVSLDGLDFEALYRTNPFDVDKYLRRMR